MTKASDVRNFFKEGRPLVEQDLDIAEQFKAMRDAARVKEVDWSKIKAILKAQILDEREGTDKRVMALVEKTDNAAAYLDMLGLGSEKNISRAAPQKPEPAPAPTQKPVERVSVPVTVPARAPEIDLTIPPFLDRRAST